MRSSTENYRWKLERHTGMEGSTEEGEGMESGKEYGEGELTLRTAEELYGNLTV